MEACIARLLITHTLTKLIAPFLAKGAVLLWTLALTELVQLLGCGASDVGTATLAALPVQNLIVGTSDVLRAPANAGIFIPDLAVRAVRQLSTLAHAFLVIPGLICWTLQHF